MDAISGGEKELEEEKKEKKKKKKKNKTEGDDEIRAAACNTNSGSVVSISFARLFIFFSFFIFLLFFIPVDLLNVRVLLWFCRFWMSVDRKFDIATLGAKGPGPAATGPTRPGRGPCPCRQLAAGSICGGTLPSLFAPAGQFQVLAQASRPHTRPVIPVIPVISVHGEAGWLPDCVHTWPACGFTDRRRASRPRLASILDRCPTPPAPFVCRRWLVS